MAKNRVKMTTAYLDVQLGILTFNYQNQTVVVDTNSGERCLFQQKSDLARFHARDVRKKRYDDSFIIKIPSAKIRWIVMTQKAADATMDRFLAEYEPIAARELNRSLGRPNKKSRP